LLPDQGRSVSTLGDYVATLRRWKWAILACAVFAPLTAILVSGRSPAVYEASAQVLINRQNLALELQGVNDPTASDATRVLETQAQLARLPEVARRTVAAAGTNEDASDLIGNSSVRTQDNNDILTLSVRDRDPATAARLATVYAEQFAKYSNELDTAAIATTLKAVDARVRSLETAGQTASPLYATLVDRAEELRTLETLQTSRAAVVRRPAGAGKLGQPPVRIAALAAILGLALGIGIVFLVDALDPRIRSEEELRAAFAFPLLGRLPPPPSGRLRTLPWRRRTSNSVVMLDAPDTPHAEAFRILATNFDLITLNFPVKKLMITSALAGEGKTTTTANLGVAFAQQGRKVVLVDFDTQPIHLQQLFSLPDGPGFLELALGRSTIEDALVEIDVATTASEPHELQEVLRPMATGPIAIDQRKERLAARSEGSLQILRSPAGALDIRTVLSIEMIVSVLSRVAAQSDLVLLDSPPLLQSSSAIALTSEVHGILVVSRLKTLTTPAVRELTRTLDEAVRTPPLGFVVTNSAMPRPMYYMSLGGMRHEASGPVANVPTTRASDQ